MISTTPDPGNPWPHDMVITVEDDPHALLDLLWVREAWGLDPTGDDLPPELLATPGSEPGPGPDAAPTDADRAAWTDAWPSLWHACLAHAGQTRDPGAHEAVGAAPPGSEERLRLLRDLVGPSWRESFGDAAFTPRHEEWKQARFAEMTAPERLRRSPERECLGALVPAWRAGLTTIVEIPCHGSATRRVGEHALLVTAGTRADPARYTEALRTFA